MKILISGSTGMVGSKLYWKLYHQKLELTRLVRSVDKAAGNDIVWDGKHIPADTSRFEGFDAVIHLAGENIASGRWSEAKKKRIRESRVIPTQNLSKLLSSLKNPPKVWVVASAIGFYGNRAAEVLTESSAAGSGFLADVCKEWEAATLPATQKGIRVVNLRFGIILSATGGALKKMLLPFKLGVGGTLGSGGQFMSWVSLDDVIGVIEKSVADTTLNGPVNVVGPTPVTNAEFTRTLGELLNRPTLLPAPVFALRLAMGEMADALLLASVRVTPKKLQDAGYAFQHPTVAEALKSALLARN
jgi:uncharacterized protein (TIGR01777 family)